MSIVSSFVNWIVKAGIKFITLLLRTAAQISGVPNARLPTERDVICEVGGTLIKSVLKAKTKRTLNKIVNRFTTPLWSMLPLNKARCIQQMPVIDI